MKHIIKKQVLDLHMDRRMDPFAIQQQVSDHFYQDLVPVMGKLFDKLVAEDTVVRLDKLELNLGAISINKINNGAWVQLVQQILEEELKRAIQRADKTDGALVQPLHLSSFEQWCYFMEHGFLPWNAGKPSPEWHSQVLESLARHYNSAATLRKLLGDHPKARERVVQQHDPAFLSHLIELLTARKQTNLESVIRELATVLHFVTKDTKGTTLTISAIRNIVWQLVLDLAASQTLEATTEQLIIRLLREELTLSPLQISRAIKKWQTTEPLHFLPDLFKQLSPAKGRHTTGKKKRGTKGNEGIQPSGGANEEDGTTPFSSKGGSSSKPITAKALANLIKAGGNKTHSLQPNTDAALAEGVFISNAGVVLLHVFLQHCFKAAGWVQQGKFIDTTAQQKAIYLIHFLATGETEAAEYELVMPKLLCGWPMEQPVETGLTLSAEELEEADQLLQSAIRQWTSLKNTSPDGLRVNFLQREGLLKCKDDKWYLQVAALSAIDLLLDTLPWTLSMIKLPWMASLLRVEWR